MPEQLEKLEELYEEWSRGDYSRSDLFAPEIKMKSFGMAESIGADSYDEFVDVMRGWLGAWERPLTVSAEKFIESGDRILVLIAWLGRGKGSGVQIEGQGAHLWKFREGLAVCCGVYRDRDEARAALEAE